MMPLIMRKRRCRVGAHSLGGPRLGARRADRAAVVADDWEMGLDITGTKTEHSYYASRAVSLVRELTGAGPPHPSLSPPGRGLRGAAVR